MQKMERAKWVELRASHGPASLLNRIGGEGERGTDGTGRKRMSDRTADVILEMVGKSGVGTAPGVAFLVDVIRWHYGYNPSATGPVCKSASLSTAEADFIRRRGYELVEKAAEGRMMMPVHDRLAK